MSGSDMREIYLPRQDHHEVAREAALRRFRQRFDAERLGRLGVDLKEDGSLELTALCWRFAVQPDPFFAATVPEGREVSIVWQILTLDYMSGEPAGPPARFLSFADFPQLRGYLKAFQGRVIERLGRGVGSDRDRFAHAAERCGGARGSGSPLSYLFHFFPKLELQVVRYEGDEDFAPSCNVLFPDNALRLLSAESAIVAADKLVASLQGKSPCD